jgi:hypothetical protein
LRGGAARGRRPEGHPILNPYGECQRRQGIAAYSLQNVFAPNCAPAYSGSYSLVWALHVEESRQGSSLHTGGEFKKVSGVVQNSYARLSPACLLWYSEREVVR